MAFHEVQFPTDISYGSGGGPGFNTAIIENDAGVEERISRWSNPRRRYNIKYGMKEQTTIKTVIDFYIARLGAAHGFRFKDFNDCKSSGGHLTALDDEDVVIGTGDNSETQFQLIKKYTSGGVTRNRNITKPVSSTVVIALDGVAKTEGVDFTVDTTTGIVTFNTAPGLNVSITAGFEFDVPVRFGEEADFLLNINHTAYDINDVPDIVLVEEVDTVAVQDEFFYGGSSNIDLTANTTVTVLTGRVLNVTPSASGKKVIVPDPDDLADGGPYFYVNNASGSYTFDIEDGEGNSLITLGTSSSCILLILDNGVDNEWLVIS